jgi:hypothetical protein
MSQWMISAASAVGTSHEAAATPCQDAFQSHREQSGDAEVLLIACADGAGSASRSDEGARWCCDEVVMHLREILRRAGPDGIDEAAMRDAVAHARTEVLERAAREGAPARDFASTLLVVAAMPGVVRVAQLGDGVVVMGAGEDLRIAVEVEQEMLNITDFLVDSDAMSKLQLWSSPSEGIECIAVSTDGLIPVLVDRRQNRPHPPMFAMLFQAMRTVADETEVSERLGAFIRSDQVNQRTDDDKSIVLAFRRPSS